jgi:hypothetical protein
MSRDLRPDVGFLCDKDAVLRDRIKGTHYILKVGSRASFHELSPHVIHIIPSV